MGEKNENVNYMRILQIAFPHSLKSIETRN
jgi:hypothetical protein